MTNKEAIEKLQVYYLTQDPITIARLCANFAIDINRFYNFEKLTIEEKFNLIERTKSNLDVTLNIIQGVTTELTLSNYEDEEQ